jgi:SPP1 gp7 family putative phage head morphogenesis protein
MPELRLEPLPFTEAIEFFRNKGYAFSPYSWMDVWGAEHVRAFTVARVTAMDLLEDIRAQVDKALAKGTSFRQFQKDFEALLDRRGWAGTDEFPPWRIATIFRTNLQSAYQAGRYKQMLEVAPRRPYWMYDAVNDMRTRPSHAALDGKVYRFDHPFWDKFYPPNGFNCRCTVRTLSEADMERRGLKESTQPPEGVEPDPGWDYNAGYEAWRPDLSKYAPRARERLVSAGVDWPRDMDQLQARLNQLREALREAGINSSTKPLSIHPHEDPRYRGLAYWDTGRIDLYTTLYDQVRQALQRGYVADSELSAMRTLRHEFGHHLGFRYDSSRYGRDGVYRYLMQAVNEAWARQTLADFLRTLNLKYDKRALARIVESDPHAGYDKLVSRLRRILRASGLDDAEMAALVARLKLSVSTGDYSKEIWAAIRTKRPDIDPDRWAHMGQIIAQDATTEYLVDALTNS